MTKLKLICLSALMVAFLSGCKDYSLVGLDQLDKYINESASNSFHIWYLEKEDQSFYYLKRKTGLASFDYFKLSKDDVIIDVKGELPALLKFADLKKKR